MVLVACNEDQWMHQGLICFWMEVQQVRGQGKTERGSKLQRDILMAAYDIKVEMGQL